MTAAWSARPRATCRSMALKQVLQEAPTNQRPYTPASGSNTFFAGAYQSISCAASVQKPSGSRSERAWTSWYRLKRTSIRLLPRPIARLWRSLERDFPGQHLAEHLPVAHEAVERLLERRRLVLLEREVADPGEAVAAHEAGDEPERIAGQDEQGE